MKTPPPPWKYVGPGASPESHTWTDGTYTVTAHRDAPRVKGDPWMVHLSMSRVDRGAMTDWREKQAIKNAFVGEECEGVEIYPAESRKVDGANQFHLWCIDDPSVQFPFGFDGRMVTDEPPMPGCTQRPGSGATPQDTQAVRDLIAKSSIARDLMRKAGR